MAVVVPRGEDVADGQGRARISHPHADVFPALWVIAAIDDGEVVYATSPGYSISATAVEITAVAESVTFAVKAPVGKLLYVRPGVGAWTFTGKDGGRGDADVTQNGRIEVALTSLMAERGNRPPPETTLSGDVIVAIDSRWMRVGQVKVQ